MGIVTGGDYTGPSESTIRRLKFETYIMVKKQAALDRLIKQAKDEGWYEKAKQIWCIHFDETCVPD